MYRLTEKEQKVPEYSYHEEFDTFEDAQERMRELYANVAYHSPCIITTKVHDRSAAVLLNDGNEISWDIEEL